MGTDPPNVSSTQVESITVPIPSLEEQRVIADIFNDLEFKIGLLLTSKIQTQQQKKGLMQKLLTGQIRVKTEQEPTSP